jgi:hypothetical protein
LKHLQQPPDSLMHDVGCQDQDCQDQQLYQLAQDSRWPSRSGKKISQMVRFSAEIALTLLHLQRLPAPKVDIVAEQREHGPERGDQG